LPLLIEQVEDGAYLATSPALSGFLVQADTIEEVVALAPGQKNRLK
jgi:predicted RNase H-like HicB family nuclease